MKTKPADLKLNGISVPVTNLEIDIGISSVSPAGFTEGLKPPKSFNISGQLVQISPKVNIQVPEKELSRALHIVLNPREHWCCKIRKFFAWFLVPLR